MKRRIISIGLLFLMLTLIFMKPVNVLADDTVNITLSSGADEYEMGETFEVSVTTNSDTEIIVSQFNVLYDSSVFEVAGYDGVIPVMHEDNNAPFKSLTSSYTFKVIGTAPEGSAITVDVEVSEGAITADLNAVKPVANSLSIRAIDHRASANADLSSLSVSHGYLDPVFSSDRTDYMVNVDNGVTSINIDCQTADANAKVSYSAERFQNLVVGENTVPITVTAENGDTKVYYVTVMRKEGETEKQTEKETEKQEETTKAEAGSVVVTYNNTQYKLITDITDIKLPDGFELAVGKYASSNISVARNSKMGLDLVYLVDKDNKGAFYVYEGTNTFSPYLMVSTNNMSNLVILEPATTLEGFAKEKVTIGTQSINAYIKKDIDQIYFFYAVNSEGKKGWYSYDSVEKTIQRAYSIGAAPIEQTTVKQTIGVGNSAEISSLNSKVKTLEQQLLEKKDPGKNNPIAWIFVGLLLIITVAIGAYAFHLHRKNEEQDELLVGAMDKIKKLNYETSGYNPQPKEEAPKAASEDNDDVSELAGLLGRELDDNRLQIMPDNKSINDEELMSEIDKALKNIAEIDED